MNHTQVNVAKQEREQRTDFAFSPLILTIVALVAYTIAAFFLVYCVHHDEHFQIIEFANFKRGNVAENTLAWEFKARLRPTVQPLIAFWLLKIFDLIRLRDPFNQAFVLRLLSGLLFIASTLKLRNALLPDLQSKIGKQAYSYLSLFFYALPLTAVRFSSENLSCCVFTIALAQTYTLLKNHGSIPFRNAFWLGILFGLSFLFRYQSALLLLGFGAWLLVYRLKDYRTYLVMFGGFAVSFLAGILIDRWFYGEWTFSAWNYLSFNILEGKSSGFGVSPWHFYISMIDYRKWFGFLNISLVTLVFLFFLSKPKHPVCWIFLAFFLAHSLIPHKEPRFLFPILIFIPFMAAKSVEYLHKHLQSARILSIASAFLLLIINSFAFTANVFSPADNSTEIFKYIRELPDKPIKIYYSGPAFFFTLNDGDRNLTPHFYKDAHTIVSQEIPPDFSGNLNALSAHKDTLTYIILDPEMQRLELNRLTPVFDPQLPLIKTLNYRNWMRHGHNAWRLYRISERKPSPAKQ